MKLSYNDIDIILDKYSNHHLGMNNLLEVKGCLRKLIDCLNNNLKGDIVELGCNNGGTSYWICIILKLYNSSKKLHVYDSWEGVPDKNANDNLKNQKNIKNQIGGNGEIRTVGDQIYINENCWKRGACQCSRTQFIELFKNNNDKLPISYNEIIIDKIELPIIHSGWIKDIPDNEYPDKICFAYFDGDLYSSIIDSFNKVYHKCVQNSIIVIDDCGDNTLVGVQNACIDFLYDKPEKLNLDAYPDLYGNWDRTNSLHICYWGGWIQKK